MMLPLEKQCNHFKADGLQCGAPRQKNSPFCFTHDPDKANERMLAWKAGGHAKRILPELKPIKLDKPRDAVKLLAQTINEVRKGEIDPRIATAIFYGANTLLKAFELAELEDRLDAIERQYGTGD